MFNFPSSQFNHIFQLVVKLPYRVICNLDPTVITKPPQQWLSGHQSNAMTYQKIWMNGWKKRPGYGILSTKKYQITFKKQTQRQKKSAQIKKIFIMMCDPPPQTCSCHRETYMHMWNGHRIRLHCSSNNKKTHTVFMHGNVCQFSIIPHPQTAGWVGQTKPIHV